MSCAVDGCDRRAGSRSGLCRLHYERRRNGTPDDLPYNGHPRRADYTDLMDLISHGVSHQDAAARVGVTAGAAARWMYRHGHLIHARAFTRIANREKAQ